MIWTILGTIATLTSTVAYIVTAMYIRAELKGVEKDRYLTVTNELFTIWQGKEFMEAQLWLLHRLQEATWESFIAAHRADMGEMAFHRVGAFYDRVGTLIRMGLINDQEILATMGGYAIAVWQKIGPLVAEARRIENSVLFQDYERMLPACHECYVPALKLDAPVNPFSLPQPDNRIRQTDLRQKLERSEPLTLLDVRQAKQVAPEHRALPGAVLIPPDEIETRYRELPLDKEVIVYCA